jgi:hypothetical protein
VRKVLRAHGYHVDEGGPLTDRLLSAWRNYRRGIASGFGKGRGTGDNSQPGAKTPHEWNNHNPRNSRDLSGERITAEDSPPAKKDFVRDANKRTKTHSNAKVHAKNLGVKGHGKSGPTGGVPGLAGDTGVNKLLPSSYADKVAGLQFDPAIAEARRALAGHGRDEKQAQADISNWYGQVKTSQGTAATRDAAAGDAARGDVSSAVQAIVQSLGGSRGAGLVGATGVHDLAQITQSGQAQDRYNADLAPLMANEQAGAASRQRAIGSQQDMALQGSITDLVGQRGGAKAKALLDLVSANNQSRQQNFQNRLSLFQTNIAGANLGMDQAKLDAQLQQYGLENKINTAKLSADKKANKGGWAALNATDRATLVGRAIQAGLAEVPAGAPWDPGHVRNAALDYLRSYGGLGSARKMGYKGRVPSKGNQQQILAAINRAIQASAVRYKASANQVQ